ncbi:hypothetical protein, partial [Halomonas sp. BM-2019]|uniref:hypothetical protein n=1 Tax=Halomonas sp. BM-2019 TaxID=2811227 RepID=UPI001B3C2BEE
MTSSINESPTPTGAAAGDGPAHRVTDDGRGAGRPAWTSIADDSAGRHDKAGSEVVTEGADEAVAV